ncbi:hypothetical protein GDO81_021219 [Engystomops pustulosus]|uniref:Uncharacterized protein n=1 Tax=Engystomops pustulosus TaxID=76066 RepID=A0AAV6YPY8_ENGPU|nr:hypothetical protein GDO81_021219 [Engystomops pustulosus]
MFGDWPALRFPLVIFETLISSVNVSGVAHFLKCFLDPHELMLDFLAFVTGPFLLIFLRGLRALAFLTIERDCVSVVCINQ